ncbi:predicted membrane protein [Longilinea arvoryzae]|uniref:Predicted membrane protein n=1 Tax=Longilinea arvoryzae TaxID=360412 RepID=A0A0S7BFT4_9CHLR|nr:putative sulfate exporter family transporter [Longilinea arvoryzae]GAP12635.1 predicted membrane protein [Longilinea arvoryzae]
MQTTKTAKIDLPRIGTTGLGALLVAGLTILAWWLTQRVYGLSLPGGIPGKALEYPIWAVLVGLLGNLALKLTQTHEKIKAGIQTELFLKTGLVLMGAGINLALMASTAVGATVQALIMIPSVFFFTYWLAGKFGLEDRLRAVMGTALSVCGVSAAIAAAGSVSARKEQVAYVIGLVILVALPLMLILPLLAGALGLSQVVAGAWFGGNIDTTAAVVGAGTLFGEQAQKIATIVKSAQNALIGVVAFLLAVYAATHGEDGKPGARPSPRMIWDRFPKFVLGFVAASILYTLGVIDGGKGTLIETIKNWAFMAAFVCMGLEFSVIEFKKMGWKPVAVFLLATLFNTLLALGVAYVIFTFLLPVAA